METLDLHPDERRLVISSNRGGSQDLWLVALDGSEVRQLTNDRGPEGSPRYSPDGQRLAFFSARRGNLDIWVLPTDGGPATQLTRGPDSDMFPAWSRDGGAIAFYGREVLRRNAPDLPYAPGKQQRRAAITHARVRG